MMEFRTPVDLPNDIPAFSLDSHVLLVGSCFVEHIGRRMQDCLPEGQVVVNPMGVLYNPESIRQILLGLMCNEMPWADKNFEGRDGLWHNWMCSTLFSAHTSAELERTLQKQWQKATHILQHKAPRIVTTWSTDMVYRIEGEVVANCHKEPGHRFVQEEIDYDEMVHSWKSLCTMLQERNASMLFTLSPYRYLKQGLTAGGASKARLRHAIDTLCRTDRQHCHYFPAYEIVMDELRDYRFYAADMVHPSEVAIEYLWQRFREWCFSADANRATDEALRLRSRLNHRFLTADTAAQQAFRAQTDKLLAEFLSRHPYLCP